ncbi:hypothetical protein M0804_013520 [Polistes exclamans]|nr:hypothetical protein M0804_013520 [Polistes exclamans]
MSAKFFDLKHFVCSKNIKKLKTLIKEKYHNKNNNNKQNTFILNFSDVELPNEAEEILNLEPGFGIPKKPKKVQVNTKIEDLEYSIKNLTIKNRDEKTMKNAKNNVKKKAVYVDDIFTAIPKDGIELTIKTFNSSISRIEDGSILTDWYDKPASSGRCLNYKSNHPISQKIVVVKGLRFRALPLVPFLKVYVNDIITAIPRDGIKVVLKTFNMINEKILFTIKIEDNGTLPFLDVTVIRNEDGTISTNWYVKPTSLGRCINYYSNHPLSQKIRTIKGLLFRALTLSNKKFHRENKEKKETLLKNNNYPKSNIKMVFNEFKIDKDRAKKPNLQDKKLKVFSNWSILGSSELTQLMENLVVNCDSTLLDKMDDFRISDEQLYIFTGLRRENIIEVRDLLITMRNTDSRTVNQALIVFLFKLRTGNSNKLISATLQLPNEQLVSKYCKQLERFFMILMSNPPRYLHQ